MDSDCRVFFSASGQKLRGTDLTGAACDSTIRDLVLTAAGNRQPTCKMKKITDCLREQLQINVGRPERRWSDRRWKNGSPTGLNLDRAEEEEVDKDSKWWRKGNNHAYSTLCSTATSCRQRVPSTYLATLSPEAERVSHRFSACFLSCCGFEWCTRETKEGGRTETYL